MHIVFHNALQEKQARRLSTALGEETDNAGDLQTT